MAADAQFPRPNVGLKSAFRMLLPAALSGLSVSLTVPAATDSPDTDDPIPFAAARTDSEPGPAASVRLSEERQRLAGIAATKVRQSTLGAESVVQGRIVDISPLLELRTRYRAALAESRIAETALALAQKNRDRLAKLSQEAIIATKELVQAESMLAAESTKAATARQRVLEIRETAIHSWGAELFRLAIEGDSSLWDALLQRRKVLALVALPATVTLPAGTRSAYIARNRERQHAVHAELLAAAPNTDNLVQGETYFFHLDAARLRTGMRVDVWIPRHGQAVSGVFLPRSAVVWYGGMPWVYVQSGTDWFSRRALSDYEEYGDGWFVRAGVQGGEQVVTVGAQLMLSEEMRGQIPEEDDD